MSLAQQFVKEYNINAMVAVDLMDNNCDTSYSAWPERLYVIQSGKIVYKGRTGPDGYHPEEIEEWLTQYMNTKSA